MNSTIAGDFQRYFSGLSVTDPKLWTFSEVFIPRSFPDRQLNNNNNNNNIKQKLASVSLHCKSRCFKTPSIKLIYANSKHRSKPSHLLSRPTHDDRQCVDISATVCLFCVCVFVRLRISPARIKLAASYFAG